MDSEQDTDTDDRAPTVEEMRSATEAIGRAGAAYSKTLIEAEREHPTEPTSGR